MEVFVVENDSSSLLLLLLSLSDVQSDQDRFKATGESGRLMSEEAVETGWVRERGMNGR